MSEPDEFDLISDTILAAGRLIDELREENELLVGRINSQEELLAQLTLGYQELTTALEVLCWKLFGNDPDAEAEFRAKHREAQDHLIGWIHDSAKHLGFSDEDLASAMGSFLQQDEPPDQRY